jgi:type VI secretion system protein ImpE
MTVDELFRAGKLQDAIQLLSAEIRKNPSDSRRRTFLFEMLCFAGDYERADKHLNLLADASPDAAIGALVYRSAVSAERKRRLFFETKQFENSAPEMSFPRPGRLNGEAFSTIEDIDPRIGARLEVFIAGEYIWLPFAHLGSLTMEKPRFLRDLLWSSAIATASPAMKGQDLGEVLLPILYPFSSKHENDSVKLGRETDWLLDADAPYEIPFGQKLLVLDRERTVPFLEIRHLQFDDSVEPGPA